MSGHTFKEGRVVKLTAEQIRTVLDEHAAWREGSGGKRADLAGAYLAGANLRYANLRGANGISWASIGPVGLNGLTMLGITLDNDGKAVTTGGTVRIFCGCHHGTIGETLAKIATNTEAWSHLDADALAAMRAECVAAVQFIARKLAPSHGGEG